MLDGSDVLGQLLHDSIASPELVPGLAAPVIDAAGYML